MQPKVNAYGLAWRRRLRLEVLTHYCGGKEPSCACCSESLFDLLALDHLEGSSQKDYRQHGSTSRFFAHLKATGYALKAQTLCHNCNACKARLGYCIHQPAPPDADEHYARMKTRQRVVLPDPTPELLAVGPAQECYDCRRVFPHTDAFFPRHPLMAARLLNLCKECDRVKHYLRARRRRGRQKMTVLRHYCGSAEPSCGCCKIAEPIFLTLDHVNGGGARHRREEKIGNMWKWAIDRGFPPIFRVRCYSCNMAAGFHGGRCPHETD